MLQRQIALQFSAIHGQQIMICCLVLVVMSMGLMSKYWTYCLMLREFMSAMFLNYLKYIKKISQTQYM